MEDQKEKIEPGVGNGEFEIEIMGNKYTSIQDLRQAIWKACKNIVRLKGELKHNKDIVQQIKEFLAKNNVSLDAEKLQESGQQKGIPPTEETLKE